MKSSPVQLISAVDTASINGSAVDVNQIISGSFAPLFGDATAAGTIKIQFSNDNPSGQDRHIFVPTNWYDVPSATSTIASGVGPGFIIPVMCFGYIRVVYTRSSGGSTTFSVNATLVSP